MGNGIIITDSNQLPSALKEFAVMHELSSNEMNRFHQIYVSQFKEDPNKPNDLVFDLVCKQILLERASNAGASQTLTSTSSKMLLSERIFGMLESPKCSSSKSARNLNNDSSKAASNGTRRRSYDPEVVQQRPGVLNMDLLTNISRSIQNMRISMLTPDPPLESLPIASSVELNSSNCNARDGPTILNDGYISPLKNKTFILDTPMASVVTSVAEQVGMCSNDKVPSLTIDVNYNNGAKHSTIQDSPPTGKTLNSLEIAEVYRVYSNPFGDDDSSSSNINNSISRSISNGRSRQRRPSLENNNPSSWRSRILVSEIKDKSKQLLTYYSISGNQPFFQADKDPCFLAVRDKFFLSNCDEGEFVKVFINGLPGTPVLGEAIEIVVVDVMGTILQRLYLPLTGVYSLLAEEFNPACSSSSSSSSSSSNNNNSGNNDGYRSSRSIAFSDLTEHCKVCILNLCCDKLHLCDNPRYGMFEMSL